VEDEQEHGIWGARGLKNKHRERLPSREITPAEKISEGEGGRIFFVSWAADTEISQVDKKEQGRLALALDKEKIRAPAGMEHVRDISSQSLLELGEGKRKCIGWRREQ
jgi:hypothetical protein